MSKKVAKLPSLYGPVDVQLISCDGPECSSCVQESYMVGWFVMGPQGMVAPTMRSVPDAMDFCSLKCLANALNVMVP